MKRSSILAAPFIVTASASSSCDGSLLPRMSCGISYTSETACLSAGCCYDGFSQGGPACFVPDVPGYSAVVDADGSRAVKGALSLIGGTGLFPLSTGDEKSLTFNAVQETSERTHIRIVSADKSLWEVPESLIPRPGGLLPDGARADTVMQASTSESGEFQFSVSRQDKVDEPIFTLGENLVFQEQYLQFSAVFGADVIATFGFGESTRAKQAIGANETRTLWNTDVAAADFDVDLYGAHPFVLQLASDGRASGYFLLSSNALEATHSLRGDAVSGGVTGIQMAGGIIDLYVFSGPTPADVIRQYQEVVGFPALLPYWSLGFHNCEWGYPNLDYVKNVVANYSAAGIPLETQWIDIDYMDKYLDFTTSPVNFPQEEMAAFIGSLHDNGQRFVPIIDPGIYVLDSSYDAYTSGVEQNVFIKDLYGNDNFIGQVWPGPTVFPDWFASNSTSYWTAQMQQFHDIVPFDGIWIDMNEVSNFCNDGSIQQCELDLSCPNGCCVVCSTPDATNRYDFSPWVPRVYHGALGGKTVPVSALHEGGILEYNVHNMYGFMESISTRTALTSVTGERPFLLSRSTFAGSGKHTAHWTGDNAATWADLAASIVTINSMAMFGIPMAGADICGFIDNTTEELCARWISVGAFSPFSRDHNTLGAAPQELYRWESVAEASRNALNMRYKLLPFLYTLMYRAHVEGITVHNALWTHFPTDRNTISTDSQYMWSDALLFTPVVKEGATSVKGYFPKGIWYQLPITSSSAGQAVVDATNGGVTVTLDTPLDTTNIHVRGGSIIPMQGNAMTTTAARETPFELLIALDASGEAHGSLFIDDGVQLYLENYTLLEYSFKDGVFSSEVIKNGYYSASSAKIGLVTIKGLKNDLKACKSISARLTGGTGSEMFNIEVLTSHEVTLKATNLLLVKDFDIAIAGC